MIAAIALVGLGLAVLNVFSTLSVVRSPLSSTGQKVAQIFLVWLLPLLGALLVLIITHEGEPRGSGQYSEAPYEVNTGSAASIGRDPNLDSDGFGGDNAGGGTGVS